MASSNRHWPSLFKSKPCNTHQWQHHDINTSSLLSSPSNCSSHKLSGLGGGSGEERSPDPKPRWNPKPEQIRILEAIFNSGMVNPPRDEIRRIRAQLQEFGQVGDANVFYWFQNRKSRSKHKQRHLQHSSSRAAAHRSPSTTTLQQFHATNTTTTAAAAVTATATMSSSSSSSERSNGSDKIISLPTMAVAAATASSSSTTTSVNQSFLQSQAMAAEFFVEPVYLQGELPGLWTELVMGQDHGLKTTTTGSLLDFSKITTKIENPNPNPNNIPAPAMSAATTTTAEIQGIHAYMLASLSFD